MRLKPIYALFLVFLINLISCNHIESDYKSAARDSYFDSISKRWKLEKLKNEVAVEIQDDFITIVPLKNPTEFIRNNENDYFDSLAKAKNINILEPVTVENNYEIENSLILVNSGVLSFSKEKEVAKVRFEAHSRILEGQRQTVKDMEDVNKILMNDVLTTTNITISIENELKVKLEEI